MTDADLTTRLERALDKAVADLARFQAEHPHEDVDVPVDVLDTVADRILALPVTTLREARLHARAILITQEDCMLDNDEVWPLLRALEALPERLWSEPVGEA